MSSFLVLSSWSTLWAQDTTGVGSLGGLVTDGDDRPAVGVQICVAETTRCSTSDATGRYRINDVRAGVYRLEITAPNLPTFVSTSVDVRAGVDAKVDVALPKIEGAQQSVTVTASALEPPEEVKTSGYLVQASEIFKNAGAFQDVSRYLQTLPGVVSTANDFRNDIIVRGGSPLENLYVVDNVEIPNINSFANFTSQGGADNMIDVAMIQDATFLTGGYPAPFINRASSVLQLTLREGNRQRFGAKATVGYSSIGTVLEGPLGKGKGSWIASARRSFYDLFTDDFGFGGIPITYAFNSKVVYDLSDRDRVWAVNVSGLDNIRLGPVEPDPIDPNETPERQEQRRERNTDRENDEQSSLDIRNRGSRSGTGVNWQRLIGDDTVSLLGVSHAGAHVEDTVKDLLRNGIPAPGTPVDELIANSPVVFRQDSREDETTLKYDLTTRVPWLQKVQVGGSAKLFRIQYDAASVFGTNSPYSLAPDQNPYTLDLNVTTPQLGAYAQATTDLTPRLNVTVGGRVDHYDYISRTRLSPRAAGTLRLTSQLSWRASYGQYFQLPPFLVLATFDENRSLLPIRADHYVTGVSFLASDSLRFTVEAYRKDYRDYPVSTQYPALSLAGVGDNYESSQVLFPMTTGGRGRASGVELFVEKKRTGRWYGQMNLAFARARHAGLDGVLRPGAYDYPRIFNITGGYQLTSKWEVSTRLSYLAGRPYTPFDIARSTAQRRGIFDLSRVNAERFTDYIRLDVRADRTFTLWNRPLVVFFGVQNISGRKNQVGLRWKRRENVAEVLEAFGGFPILGLDWRLF